MQEISLNILDLAENSIAAGATLIEIGVDERTDEDTLTVTVGDNGRGMSPQQLKAVTDPFYTTRTTRKVGLGVPFFKMNADMSGGSFDISSKEGGGTCVRGVFGLSNIDRMPLGDIGATIATLIYCNPERDGVYTRSRGVKSGTLVTRQARERLGGIPLNAGEVMS